MAIVADLSGNSPKIGLDRNNAPNSKGFKTLAITLPATPAAYAAKDVVGGLLTFDNMQYSGGGNLVLISANLLIGASAIPSGMSAFEIHMYNASPPSAYADNAAWDLPPGDTPYYMGKVTLYTPTDEGSSLFTYEDNITKDLALTTENIYAYLVTVGSYTPAAGSEVYRIKLHGIIPNEL